MSISYDKFVGAFLSKITEFDLLTLEDNDRHTIVDGYLRRAVSSFQHICKYDLVGAEDDENRVFNIELEDDDDITEIIDIVSEGMVVNWLKPYVNRQENLELVMNTRDFTTYSSAELLYRIGERFRIAQANFIRMMRDYSYNHGDLTVLHL